MGDDNIDDIEEQLLKALEAQYSFPGMYPVVVIAGSGEAFHARLLAALTYELDGREFAINTRESGGGKYISYKIEMFVDTAKQALERKEFLHSLEGVLMIL